MPSSLVGCLEFKAIHDEAQELLLVLFSRFIPGCSQGTICSPGEKPGSATCKGKHLNS